MTSETLTEQEIAAVRARLAEPTTAEAYLLAHALPQPAEPAEGTWQHEAMLAQERKRREREAAAAVEHERQACERAEREKAAREAREAAAAQLEELGPQLREAENAFERLETERAKLQERFGSVLERARRLRRAAS